METQAHQFKTPAQVAALFGCTEKQARAQMEKNRAGLLAMLTHMRAKRLAKYRGYTDAQLSERVQSLNAALA